MKLFKTGGKLHWLKNLYLRYKEGAGCCDSYSLCHYLAPTILRGLKVFRRNAGSYPADLKSLEEWQKLLDDMIFAFAFVIADDFGAKKKDYARTDRGLKLFGKYYRDLWW